MTPELTPAAPTPGSRRVGWRTALVGGGLVFLVMAALGQALAFLVALLGDARISLGTVARIGWLYFGAFHRAGVVTEVPELSMGPLLELGGGTGADAIPGGLGLSARLDVALLLATGLALFLLFRAGRAAADAAGGSPAVRILAGAAVAPVYALPAFLISLLVRIDVPFSSELVSGSLGIRPAPAAAFLWPLGLAAAAGAAGGLRSARRGVTAGDAGRRVVAALEGGWRMFLVALALSFVGLLVLAGVKPSATAAYFRGVTEGGADGALVTVGHHVLLLPNQSLLVLVPAMGGCDGFYGSGVTLDALCLWRFPEAVSIGTAPGEVPGGFDPSGLVPRFDTGVAPAGYFLFLLVPLLSVLFGGREAARVAASFRGEAVGIGALAGLVFALLVGIGAVMGGLGIGVSASVAALGAGGSFALGPKVAHAVVLGLAWGVAGGALGGFLVGRTLPAAPPEPPAPEPPQSQPPAPKPPDPEGPVIPPETPPEPGGAGQVSGEGP